MKFLILNGPNLNLLGQREPGVYGDKSYDALCQYIAKYANAHDSHTDFFQSNYEGAIIDAIHAAQGHYDAIVINPGAYTHYSYAIFDALKAVTVPAFEVHLSDIHNRESFRKISVTAPACVGQIYGMGFDSYLRAIDHFLSKGAPPSSPISAGKGLCVIGDPVAHSKSPLIQNAMLRHLGLEPVYTHHTVKLDELTTFVEKAKSSGKLFGFNATMPHKQALLPLLDRIDKEVEELGAVNTVTIEHGQAVGHNTDGRGFLAALQKELAIHPKDKVVTILGAGGAARAVANALARAEAGRVNICNRNIERAEELARSFPTILFPAGLEKETLSSLAMDTQILINCTNLGMAGQKDFHDLSFLSTMPQDAVVCDLVYQPANTALLQAARERGLSTMGGLGMLIHQAIFALEYFLGRNLDHSQLAKVAWQAMDGSL